MVNDIGKLIDKFKKMYDSESMSHAFLIGNTFFDSISRDLEIIISNYIFKKQIKIRNNINISIIEPNQKKIDTLSINNLISDVNITSQFDSKKVYIITNANCISDIGYNKLLKTIEEPPENIYIFLVAENIDSILPTIRSRCLNIYVSDNKQELNEKQQDDILKFLDNIEKNGLKCIGINHEIYKQIKDKEKYKEYLEYIYQKYNKDLENICNNSSTFDQELIIKLCSKIEYINSLINSSYINTNKDLSIDKLIIGIWRCNNEICNSKI